jgi:carboxymethylenebutenolidase
MTNRIIIGTIIVILVGIAVFGFNFFKDSSTIKTSDATPAPTNSQMLLSDKNTEIITDEVAYFNEVKGFYASPKEGGNYPGVIMVHEWWGLNDHIKSMARELAKEGYQVLAVDLYNGKVAQNPDEAMQYTGSLNQELAIDNMISAKKYLSETKSAPKIAALGWCFGGGQALQLSTTGQPLDATVIYYGNLVEDRTKLDNINWPVLGIFGDQDQSIPVEKVKAFEAALNELNVKNSINIYTGVGHAFANPTGANYAPNETKDAWNKTLEFLNTNLKES